MSKMSICQSFEKPETFVEALRSCRVVRRESSQQMAPYFICSKMVCRDSRESTPVRWVPSEASSPLPWARACGFVSVYRHLSRLGGRVDRVGDSEDIPRGTRLCERQTG